MGKTTTKKESDRKVSYHGQRPHRQGKRPGPLLCFTFNLKNALRRAFPKSKYNANGACRRKQSRIECLMDFLAFDINQLLIYENQKKTTNPGLIQKLRAMKTKTEEVKLVVANDTSLLKVEEILRRRSHLKCTSRSLRRKLIEFMANMTQSVARSRTICAIMKQLDSMDMEIAGVCKTVKDTPIALSADFRPASTLSALKSGECGDAKAASGAKICSGSGKLGTLPEIRELPEIQELPEICEEVMRPYDPITDEDSQSIHLSVAMEGCANDFGVSYLVRLSSKPYVPTLDTFKADMARNPDALRLPLMCPPLKKIMNKMKSCYLMDDVPCDLSLPLPRPVVDRQLRYPVVNCVRVAANQRRQKYEIEGGIDTPERLRSTPVGRKSSALPILRSDPDDEVLSMHGIDMYNLKDILIKKLKEIYS